MSNGARLLLDTHTLIWWAEDNPRLPPATDARIRHADLVSIASAWEIAIKGLARPAGGTDGARALSGCPRRI